MREWVGIALTAVVAAPALGQDRAARCEVLTRITVGQWAEYRVNLPQAGGTMQMRLAIVGMESVSGKSHYWHEMRILGDRGAMILQLLVPSFPYDNTEIAALVMKAGDQPAMRMPAEMVGMTQQVGGGSVAKEAVESCEQATVVGMESVDVPAGKFEALHLRAQNGNIGDMWLAGHIPFGLVKMTGTGGQQMVLLGHGKDAKSSITEEPQVMPGTPDSP